MPSWYTDNLLDRLKLIQDFSFNLFFNTEEKKKITGGINLTISQTNQLIIPTSTT